MGKLKSLEDIVRVHDTIESLVRYLEDCTEYMAIMFIDMCGSTELKEKPQMEWLPDVCRFLLSISDVVKKHDGRIVKYIGDEALVVFAEDENKMAATRTENCIWECEEVLKGLSRGYQAKYALDYGSGAEVDFPNVPQDVLGTCVDRCARISKLLMPQTAVATHSFIEKSKHKTSWRLLGNFPFKGLPGKTKIYQLQELGQPLEILDPLLQTESSMVLAKMVIELREKLARCTKELGIHRTKSSTLAEPPTR